MSEFELKLLQYRESKNREKLQRLARIEKKKQDLRMLHASQSDKNIVRRLSARNSLMGMKNSQAQPEKTRKISLQNTASGPCTKPRKVASNKENAADCIVAELDEIKNLLVNRNIKYEKKLDVPISAADELGVNIVKESEKRISSKDGRKLNQSVNVEPHCSTEDQRSNTNSGTSSLPANAELNMKSRCHDDNEDYVDNEIECDIRDCSSDTVILTTTTGDTTEESKRNVQDIKETTNKTMSRQEQLELWRKERQLMKGGMPGQRKTSTKSTRNIAPAVICKNRSVPISQQCNLLSNYKQVSRQTVTTCKAKTFEDNLKDHDARNSIKTSVLSTNTKQQPDHKTGDKVEIVDKMAARKSISMAHRLTAKGKPAASRNVQGEKPSNRLVTGIKRSHSEMRKFDSNVDKGKTARIIGPVVKTKMMVAGDSGQMVLNGKIKGNICRNDVAPVGKSSCVVGGAVPKPKQIGESRDNSRASGNNLNRDVKGTDLKSRSNVIKSKCDFSIRKSHRASMDCSSANPVKKAVSVGKASCASTKIGVQNQHKKSQRPSLSKQFKVLPRTCLSLGTSNKNTTTQITKSVVRFGEATVIENSSPARLSTSTPRSLESDRILSPGFSQIKRRRLNEHPTPYRSGGDKNRPGGASSSLASKDADVGITSCAEILKDSHSSKEVKDAKNNDDDDDDDDNDHEIVMKTPHSVAFTVKTSKTTGRKKTLWRADEVMRDNLARWLSVHGKSLSSYRHSCCFGLSQADLANASSTAKHPPSTRNGRTQPRLALRNATNLLSKSSSIDTVKQNLLFTGLSSCGMSREKKLNNIKLAVSKCAIAATNDSKSAAAAATKVDRIQAAGGDDGMNNGDDAGIESNGVEGDCMQQSHVYDMLKECLSLMEKGFPARQLLDWLDDICGRIPAVRRTAFYWTSRARLTAVSEKWTDIQSILAVIDEGYKTGAKPIEELEVSRLQLKSEFRMQQARCEEKKQQRLQAAQSLYSRVASEVQAENMFKSSTIAYQVKSCRDDSTVMQSAGRPSIRSARRMTEGCEAVLNKQQHYYSDEHTTEHGNSESSCPDEIYRPDKSCSVHLIHSSQDSMVASSVIYSMTPGQAYFVQPKGLGVPETPGQNPRGLGSSGIPRIDASFVDPGASLVTPVRRSTRKSLARLPVSLRDHDNVVDDLELIRPDLDQDSAVIVDRRGRARSTKGEVALMDIL